MNTFKFLTYKKNSIYLSNNDIFGFNPDDWVIMALKYFKEVNQPIINNDISLNTLNIPFNLTHLRITDWVTIDNHHPWFVRLDEIEIRYKIFEVNNSFPYEFRLRMYGAELMRQLGLI